MKVNETGINITDGTITLNANKTKIIGDLELHDEEQGLVIYDDDNVEQISVKSDSIGELSEDGFGVRIIGEGDAISYLQGGENKAVFEPISFGNVTQNEHVNISQILAIINTGYVTATPQYEYTVKCNGQTIATRNGTAIPAVYSSSYYYIPGCEGTASATGELTVSLILKCNAGVSFHTKIYLSTKKTGLNKIGSDGAVFANSREQYNWFGSDKTVIANNGTKVQVDNTSAIIQKGNSELKVDSTGIWKKQSNAYVPLTTVDVSTGNAGSFFATRSGLIVTNSNSTVYLPDPNATNRGMVYYIKSLGDGTKVKAVSGGSVMVYANESSSRTSITIDSNASMFISTGSQWIHFYCG